STFGPAALGRSRGFRAGRTFRPATEHGAVGPGRGDPAPWIAPRDALAVWEDRRMLLGLALFWVGAVLCLNGLWLLERIGDREIAVIDVFVGFVTLLVSLFLAFGPGANAATVKAAALTLLFTFTYFWVAWNRWNG